MAPTTTTGPPVRVPGEVEHRFLGLGASAWEAAGDAWPSGKDETTIGDAEVRAAIVALLRHLDATGEAF